MNRINMTVAILAFMAVVSGCFFGTSSTTVHGIVMNYGKPVSGAEVSFGQALDEEIMTTGPDGKFTLTAKHRPTAILQLKVKKAGFAQDKEIKFPGFAAPTDEIKVEMLKTVSYPGN